MNLIELIFINLIIILFLFVIIVYFVFKIIENNRVYLFVSLKLDEINRDYKISEFYKKVRDDYYIYSKENFYVDVNIILFIEEVVFDLKYNNLLLLEKIRSIKNLFLISILFGVLGMFVGFFIMFLCVDIKDIINLFFLIISSM